MVWKRFCRRLFYAPTAASCTCVPVVSWHRGIRPVGAAVTSKTRLAMSVRLGLGGRKLSSGRRLPSRRSTEPRRDRRANGGPRRSKRRSRSEMPCHFTPPLTWVGLPVPRVSCALFGRPQPRVSRGLFSAPSRFAPSPRRALKSAQCGCWNWASSWRHGRLQCYERSFRITPLRSSRQANSADTLRYRVRRMRI